MNHRKCMCGCGHEIPSDSFPLRRYINDRHRWETWRVSKIERTRRRHAEQDRKAKEQETWLPASKRMFVERLLEELGK